MKAAQVLVVEDESIVARNIQNTLRSLGYDVPDPVACGDEAVRRTQVTQPDVVLMDIMLKGEMDGVAAAEQIRERFDVPVVYLTAYTDEQTLQRAKITEPFGYLLKPFEARELHITIEMALYRHRMEKKLQHTQKLESLGILAGGIAHDFNNLLVSILGNAGLALVELSPLSPARHSIEEINLAAQRAAELTNQLLAYSGKSKLDVKPLRLNQLVEEMLHLLETVISKKALLEFSLARDLPLIEGDASQLRQVVMNLITNASEAMGDSTGAIKISTDVMPADRRYLSATFLGELLPEGRYVYFEVTDVGCGMDTETLAKIFDPFFTTKFTGRGLGLAAVLGIVRGHRGAIKVDSGPGQGTCVRVLIPVSSLAKYADSQAGRIKPKELDRWRGQGIVLVVEDEHAVRDVTARMLKHAGFGTLTAKDGSEGVEVFRMHADDIIAVLLDLTMPILNGEQALRRIRCIRPDARVILTSGFSEEAAAERFADMGLVGFIQKPYQPGELIEKFREVLEKTG